MRENIAAMIYAAVCVKREKARVRAALKPIEGRGPAALKSEGRNPKPEGRSKPEIRERIGPI
jgi:hypothetical protein